MKKIIFLCFIISLFASANACEICGCGLGNYYIGRLPHFNKQFIGVRYQFHRFHTQLKDEPDEFSRDFYQTVEVWSGWNIGKRLQLLVFVPFHFNHQISDEGTVNLNGPGDMAFVLNYKLLDKTAGKNHTVSQQLWVGAGLKLPTGKFEIEPGDPAIASQANTQRGSGSTDFLLNLMYNISIDKWGIAANAGYKINRDNKDAYQFGNKFTSSAFLYYAAPVAKALISPNAGLLVEQNGSSKLNSEKIDLTGGSLLQAAVGVEINLGKITVGCNAQLPVSQNFAGGQTRSTIKGMGHISFAL